MACSETQPGTDEQVKSNVSKKEAIDSETKIPVEATIVKKQRVEEKLPFTAVLKPLHSVDIISEGTGKIININKDLGSNVNKNEIIAMIDDAVAKSNYDQSKARVLTTENNLEIAKLNLKSDGQLFKNGDISKLQYDNSVLAVKSAEANHLASLANLKFMQKQFEDTRIKSPISGIIARKYVELGDMVNPSLQLFRVVDMNTLKLEIGVPQAYISIVKAGNAAEIIISALKNSTHMGFVKYISPQADENTGAFTTEIHLKNTDDQKIKAGLTSKVNLILKTKDKHLITPKHSIITKNYKKYIYKINNSIASLQAITEGGSFGPNTVIESGISEGDTIVVVGMKNLGLETPVWIETLHEL